MPRTWTAARPRRDPESDSPVILFPAIDLKDGAAVRLLRGEMGSAKLYNPDPAAQARSFAEAGFQWLHLVDLNGAFAGRPVNRDAVEAILDAVELPVQLGGGIRDLATIETWLEAGIARVILGTAAVKDPDLVRAAYFQRHRRRHADWKQYARRQSSHDPGGLREAGNWPRSRHQRGAIQAAIC